MPGPLGGWAQADLAVCGGEPRPHPVDSLPEDVVLSLAELDFIVQYGKPYGSTAVLMENLRSQSRRGSLCALVGRRLCKAVYCVPKGHTVSIVVNGSPDSRILASRLTHPSSFGHMSHVRETAKRRFRSPIQ